MLLLYYSYFDLKTVVGFFLNFSVQHFLHFSKLWTVVELIVPFYFLYCVVHRLVFFFTSWYSQ